MACRQLDLASSLARSLVGAAALLASAVTISGCLGPRKAPLDQAGYVHPTLPLRVRYEPNGLMPKGWALANYAIRGDRLELVKSAENARVEVFDLDGDGDDDVTHDVPRDDLRFVALEGDGAVWLRHVLVNRSDFERPLPELLHEPGRLAFGAEHAGFEVDGAHLGAVQTGRWAGLPAFVGDYREGKRRVRLVVARAPFKKQWVRPTDHRVYTFDVLLVAGAAARSENAAASRNALESLLSRCDVEGSGPARSRISLAEPRAPAQLPMPISR